MFEIFEKFVSSLDLDKSLHNALIEGSRILYEEVCGSGDAMGLNSYDTTHYRNLSVEPEKHHYNVNEEHELGEDACDVNKGGKPTSTKTGTKGGLHTATATTTPDKISKNNSGGNRGTIHGSLKNGSKNSKKASKAKNQFGKFADKLKIGQKEKAPLIRGFEEFMNSALKKKFS